jgi:hypothetical protein
MEALVSLRAGGRSALGSLVWPAPGSEGGSWVAAGVDGEPRDVRGFEASQLPWWLDDEIWVVELAGQVQASGRILLAERARLVRRVEGWDAEAQDAFVAACGGRVAELAAAALEREGRSSEAAKLRSADDLESAAGELEGVAGAALLAGLARDVFFYHRDAGRGARGAGTAGYIAAHAAGGGDKTARGYDAGFEAERRWQAEWLSGRLGLDAPRREP